MSINVTCRSGSSKVLATVDKLGLVFGKAGFDADKGEGLLSYEIIAYVHGTGTFTLDIDKMYHDMQDLLFRHLVPAHGVTKGNHQDFTTRFLHWKLKSKMEGIPVIEMQGDTFWGCNSEDRTQRWKLNIPGSTEPLVKIGMELGKTEIEVSGNLIDPYLEFVVSGNFLVTFGQAK
jgi:hypothetical protein